MAVPERPSFCAKLRLQDSHCCFQHQFRRRVAGSLSGKQAFGSHRCPSRWHLLELTRAYSFSSNAGSIVSPVNSTSYSPSFSTFSTSFVSQPMAAARTLMTSEPSAPSVFVSFADWMRSARTHEADALQTLLRALQAGQASAGSIAASVPSATSAAVPASTPTTQDVTYPVTAVSSSPLLQACLHLLASQPPSKLVSLMEGVVSTPHMQRVLLQAFTTMLAPLSAYTAPATATATVASSPSSSSSPLFLHNAICDVCKLRVAGVRYKCTVCSDYVRSSALYTSLCANASHRICVRVVKPRTRTRSHTLC